MAAAVRLRYGGRRALPALLVPLLLAGCGTGGGHGHHGAAGHGAHAASAAPAGAGYNDADVMFLQMMIAHHRQGVEMARLAAARARRAEVRTLAAAVVATQSDEVRTMSSWLGRWSKPTRAPHAPGAHAEHGGLPATGADEIRALKAAKGTAFEPAFLNLFVAHQHNAVKMARTEKGKGRDPGARAFAGRVEESRTDQIRQLLGLLNG
ncbi:DUF305 domain-containing protein [Actinomadura sp. 21ATH]|uniref:DUF305 domain-containing protein n=1 Tax=Actinomadura sp. 21ATH TaxID=1735444 RepID=UPI0035C14C85